MNDIGKLEGGTKNADRYNITLKAHDAMSDV